MKNLICFLLCIAMMLTFVACSTPTESQVEAEEPETTDSQETPQEEVEPDELKGKIGACLPSLGFEFQLQMSNGIERAAQEHGYEYMSYDYNGDAENMLSGLETMVGSDVGAMYGLFVAPESATSFMQSNPDIGFFTQSEIVPGAQACTENDYVELANQFIDSLDYFITENNITEGEIATLWIEASENEDSEYFAAKQDILEVFETWGSENNFTVGLEFYPKDNEDAANSTAQILNSSPNTKVIFCQNNGFAITAANEISAAVADTSDYFVFASEGDEETFRLISSGTSPYRGCAYTDVENSGYAVGLQLINWIENKEMENAIVEKELVDSRNIADYVK